MVGTGVTQTAFLRAIGVKGANSLRSFRTMKGKGAGAANMVYVKAYRFFEQKRILDGKPKSKKRLTAEKKQGAGGFPLRHDNGMRWVFAGF